MDEERLGMCEGGMGGGIPVPGGARSIICPGTAQDATSFGAGGANAGLPTGEEGE